MAYTDPEIDLSAPAGILPAGSSWLDVADASTYFATSFNSAVWNAISAADQTIALTEATRWLETLCWKGEKCDPAQVMAWPRKIDATGCCASAVCTTLPSAIVQAVAELALALHLNKTAIIGSGGSSGGGIKKAQLGGLSVEYFEGGAGAVSKYGATAPLVLQKFPWLGDLLGECYLDGSFGRSRVIARVRS
jgi:hypothetical protein